MSDDDMRQNIVSLVESEVRTIRRASNSLVDVTNIVMACSSHSNGIQDLFDFVNRYEKGSHAINKVPKVIGPLFCDIFVSAENGITYDHLKDLKAILNGVEFDIVDVRTAFDRRGGDNLARLKHTNPEREFRALLWTAATERKLQSGRMPLVSFVQGLAELPELAPAKSAELTEWCEEVGRQLKIDITKPQPVRSTQPHKDPCLQIVVEVSEVEAETLAETDLINVSAQLWLNDTETDWRHFTQQPTTLLGLPSVVFRFIEDNCKQCLDDLTIEVFLPYGLLKRYAVEEWSVNLENGVKKYFRKLNPLVLRASDRFYDPWSLAACKKRWQHLQALQQTLLSSPSSLVWVCNTDMSQIKQYYEPTIVGAALLIKPDEIPRFDDDEGNSKELLQHFITEGLPMLMWTRQELAGDDIEHYRTTIHNSVPHRVPHTILEQRRNDTKRWRHVALLWDNPNRIPHYFDDQRAETPLSKRSS